jgi:hypothetical protein
VNARQREYIRTMSLLSPTPEPSNKYKAMTYAGFALFFTLLTVLYFTFRYYPEKKATERFLDTVAAGKMREAYQLWKPAPSYAIGDFMADWGPEGYYGPVKSYEIVKATARKGANGVIVSVLVSPYSPMPDKSDLEKSRRTKPLNLWVNSDDKSFSFPPSFQ